MEQDKITITLNKKEIYAEKDKEVISLYNKSRFGEIVDDKVCYSLAEVRFLLEKGRVRVKDAKNKVVSKKDFIKMCPKLDKNFFVRYSVFKDLRQSGYVVKSALKFGSDFMVYDKGIKPGKGHAKWLVYPLKEGEKLNLYDFTAKSRIANTTKKTLLLALVDERGDVSYWDNMRIKP